MKTESSNTPLLPEPGFTRLSGIIGDPKRGIPPLIPISKSEIYRRIKDQRFPAPVKLSAGSRVSMWRNSDLNGVLLALAQGE
jgi:hypothetical protein